MKEKNVNGHSNEVASLVRTILPEGSRVVEVGGGHLVTEGQLPLVLHEAFWAGIADALRRGVLERPESVVIVSHVADDEEDETRTGIPEDYNDHLAGDLLAELTKVTSEDTLAVGFELACGCGLRVRVLR
jgi:hypothetical protein